jgi:hypothetical protein
MGVAKAADYQTVFRKLFPPGDYWDRQFADPESDVSLFCKAKLPEFIRFRRRMTDLKNESVIPSAEETLDDWERVRFGAVSHSLDTATRRELLLELEEPVTIPLIKRLGAAYGLTVTDVRFPFRSAFFGFSRLGQDRVTSPHAFSVLKISVNGPVEEVLFGDLPKRRFGKIRFGQDKMAYFPIRQLRIIISNHLRASSFGFMRLGQHRIFSIPLDAIIPLIQERLGVFRLGRIRFGQDRTAWFKGGFSPRLVSGEDWLFADFVSRITGTRFIPRFKTVLIKNIVHEQDPFRDFERAVTNKLLANHIPIFKYQGA